MSPNESPGTNNPLKRQLEAEMASMQARMEAPPEPAPQETAQTAALANPAQAFVPDPQRRNYWASGTRRMQVDPIPGYRLYWHAERDVNRALASKWEFVDPAEVKMNSLSVGGDFQVEGRIPGNTDLGSRVSIVGSPSLGARAYLMKLRNEYAMDDKREKFAANAAAVRSIFVGERILMPQIDDQGHLVAGVPVMAGPDSNTYVKTPYTALMNRGPKVSPQVTGAIVR